MNIKDNINYSPKKKYPVSFILHGVATTFNAEVVKLYVNKDSYNCDSLERIVAYPGCWFMCPGSVNFKPRILNP